MQQQSVPRGWAGIDVGKGHHWMCLIDEDGTTRWSSKVVNDEGVILEAIGEVLARAEQVVWAVDVTGSMSALLLALLAAQGQQVSYVPGRTANQMAVAYRGEAKTDARDAYVIAETVRHRGDLHKVEVPTALVSELVLLVAHRSDLEIRRVLCSTNAIESLNARFRRAVRARGHFPTEQAAMKTLYLVVRSLDPKGTGQTRWVTRWKPALNAFAITFADRMPAAEDH
jgi:transposase